MHDDALVTARAAGLCGCQTCGRVLKAPSPSCPRCGARVTGRDRLAMQRVMAWLVAGLIAYIPALTFPMLLTSTISGDKKSTILAGIADFVDAGAYGVALIIFVASVLIPVIKFLAIAYLAITLRNPPLLTLHARHRLYEFVEFIGRWSMIDVFVVAITAGLVQLENVATVTPGIAAVSFALCVAFTMLSAQSFDPRSIWDADMTGKHK